MYKTIKYEIESNRQLIIAHFSDIHFAKVFNLKKFKQILEKMKNLNPDYICITGDIVDNIGITKNNKIKYLINFLNDLSNISKVLICLGNHDTRNYKSMTDNKWYLNLNKKIILLNNSKYEDNNVFFYGLTMNNDYYKHERKNELDLALKLKSLKMSSNKFNILLFHSPINFDKNKVQKVNNFDLVLTGHTHNGITPHFIPGNYGVVGPSGKLFLKNARNSFKSGKSTVIISGGITKLSLSTGFCFLNNFFASDINYIFLKKSEKN